MENHHNSDHIFLDRLSKARKLSHKSSSHIGTTEESVEILSPITDEIEAGESRPMSPVKTLNSPSLGNRKKGQYLTSQIQTLQDTMNNIVGKITADDSVVFISSASARRFGSELFNSLSGHREQLYFADFGPYL
jgi:hypothetical protein